MADVEVSAGSARPWFLRANFPVQIPSHPTARGTSAEFEKFVRAELQRQIPSTEASAKVDANAADDDFTVVGESEASTTGEIKKAMEDLSVDTKNEPPKEKTGQPFVDALLATQETEPQALPENHMLTDNADLAFASTGSAIVDLFSELSEHASGARLRPLFAAAWEADAPMTLKIIFNGRSIHLGKSSRNAFYIGAGWLALNHPLTLVGNLQWLNRPMIETKAPSEEAKKDKEGGTGSDEGIVEVKVAEAGVEDEDIVDPYAFDIERGGSHGYWKDLLNLVVLSVHGKLDGVTNPTEVLYTQEISSSAIRKRKLDGEGRVFYNADPVPRAAHHQTAVKALSEAPLHRSLHWAVARLFADQLRIDLEKLCGDDEAAKKTISLCGKWAPTTKHFHDRHTFIVSSIAELMHPETEFPNLEPQENMTEREVYLRYAREKYRQEISALRKHLDVVERHLTNKDYAKVKYQKVPSMAMDRYKMTFAQKDTDRFDKYLDKVAAGKAKISGATLFPSTLVRQARAAAVAGRGDPLKAKIAELERKALDGQWKTLVQRIKDSGTLSNSIAVCDVSGSMGSPVFRDRTAPIDSAIGLSLLIAEVTQPPFGGMFVTFSGSPSLETVEAGASFCKNVGVMEKADWGMNTDFVAVFRDLILATARKHEIKKEDMVKQVFVFSDMQFDDSRQSYYTSNPSSWRTSYETIKQMYDDAGYDVPQLVFWNLAAGGSQPKPVMSDAEGTCLVGGYSHGMLKVFLDGGLFDEDAELELEVEGGEGGNDEEFVEVQKQKKRMDALALAKRAVSHRAYSMLRVLD